MAQKPGQDPPKDLGSTYIMPVAVSDIGALWKEALANYQTETGINLENYGDKTWNVFQIAMDQENQLQGFKVLRHDRGRLDKARSLVARNSEFIQKAAEMVADAASTSFPPSCAILTAFTCVMTAAKKVSENYDTVEAFFDVMNIFLQRLSLLEGKLPREPVYRTRVTRVFCSLLTLSGCIQRYTQHWGRFKAWAKAMFEGTDDKLKSAYDAVNKDLNDLEKATVMKTLQTAIEISEDVKALHETTGQVLETSRQTLFIATRIDTSVQRAVLLSTENARQGQEVLSTVHRLELLLQETANQKAADISNASNSGAPKKKASALDFLLGHFRYLDMKPKLNEIDKSYVPGTFDWIDTHDAFRALVRRETRILCVSGVDGMGKTTLCYSIARRLRTAFEKDGSSSVAVLFARDGPCALSLGNLMQSCCLQVAEKDPSYRDIVNGFLLESVDIYSDDSAARNLFSSLFRAESHRSTVLVLDAIEALDDGCWTLLRGFITTAVEEKLRIQFVLSSPPNFETGLDGLEPTRVELTKELIQTDIRAVAVATLNKNSFPALAKLKPSWRKRLVESLSASADRKFFCPADQLFAASPCLITKYY